MFWVESDHFHNTSRSSSCYITAYNFASKSYVFFLYSFAIIKKCRIGRSVSNPFRFHSHHIFFAVLVNRFDIEVNGETKASHGKGYHSYLNTAVALAFRNYFHDYAKYHADFLIIDTPLHGFDENDTELPDSMKEELFTYFVHHLTGQLIIVENTDLVLSHIDFEAFGANVITFTKKRDEGRYGSLHDVY